MGLWPASAQDLIARQKELAAESPPPWEPGGEPLVGGCFVCFERGGPSGPGRAGEPGWVGAALVRGGTLAATAVVTGPAGSAYAAGLLALRECPLLETVVRALPTLPDVLLVNSTGRDHPRRAGLALHLGVVLDVPTVGVTHRALVAHGQWPPDEHGARSPLLLDGALVGYWVRTRPGTRPLAVNAAWRTEPQTAAAIVLQSSERARTPEPLRQARRVARTARAAAR